MRTIHAALALMAERFGVSELRPDSNGFAEIIFVDALSLYVRVVEETALELSLRLPGFDGHPKPEVLAGLLRWNATSQGARLALEPGRNGVVLGQRFEIGVGTDEAFVAGVTDFVLTALDWHQGGADDLRERVMRHSETESIPELGAVRL